MTRNEALQVLNDHLGERVEVSIGVNGSELGVGGIIADLAVGTLARYPESETPLVGVGSYLVGDSELHVRGLTDAELVHKEDGRPFGLSVSFTDDVHVNVFWPYSV